MNPCSFDPARRFTAVAGALLMCVGLAATPAHAVDDLGLFELDGNAVDSPPGGAQDWQTFSIPPAISRTGIISDTLGQTTFEIGSKDTSDIGTWHHGAGSSPPKDEIQDAYAVGYLYTGPDSADGSLLTNDSIIYAGLDRYSTNGTANAGFWFFQQSVSLNPNGTFIGNHVDGDLLVVVEFTGGGSVANARVYRWTGSAETGTIVLVQSLANADCTATHLAGDPCGRSNSGNAQLFWPYTGKTNQGTNVAAPGAFVEFGVNVSRLARLAGGGAAPCFASFLATTRSSVSETATIKDFAGPRSFASCGIALTKNCTSGVANASQTGFIWGFNGTVTNTGSGTLFDVVVTDSGPDQTLGTSDDFTALNLATLGPNAVANYSGTFETQGSTPNPAINIAQVDAAVVAGGPKIVSDGPVQATCPQVNLPPGLSVTKNCETRLAVVNNQVVVRVLVSGQVCNTGASNLSNVSVVNDNGTPDVPGDDSILLSGASLPATNPDACLPYQGNYFPSNAVAIPGNAQFQDTVRANGTAALGFPNPPQATGSDTCPLCPACPTCP